MHFGLTSGRQISPGYVNQGGNVSYRALFKLRSPRAAYSAINPNTRRAAFGICVPGPKIAFTPAVSSIL